jgi:acyl-coenzyme A synthetase/AMP-(fatty) acid ligase
VQRLAALAVADGLTEAQVLAGLAGEVDPVFLPRPLVLVSTLPRNEVGKLPRDKLIAALKR